MPDDHKQTPTTVKEVGIHVGYLREDIGELKDLLSKHIEIAAIKSDVEKEVARLDSRIDSVERAVKRIVNAENSIYKKITGIVISGLVLMILAQYGIDKFFRP